MRRRRESAANLLKSARIVTKDFKDMQIEMNLANTKIDKLQKEVNESTVQITNLKTRMTEKDKIIDNQNKKIEALEEDLNVMKKQHDELSCKYEEVIKKNSDLESKIENILRRVSTSATTTARTDDDNHDGSETVKSPLPVETLPVNSGDDIPDNSPGCPDDDNDYEPINATYTSVVISCRTCGGTVKMLNTCLGCIKKT